jgi:hypothetical protein
MKPVETRIDLEYYRSQSVDFHAYFEELVEWISALKDGTLNLEEHKYSKYYPVNLQRMKRGVKVIKPSDRLKNAVESSKDTIEWFVLTEQWCGDAAQSLPLFYRLQEMYPEKVRLSLLCRDQNLELMDQFLTNGGRGIPKVIQFNSSGDITGTWGPRPVPAQQLVMDYRSKGIPYDQDLHTWYARDKYATLQDEVAQLIEHHMASA